VCLGYADRPVTTEAVASAELAAQPLVDPAAGLIVVSAISSQCAAAVAVGVFSRIGAVGTAGGRVGFSAVFLLLATGFPRGRSRAEWRPIVPLGITLALMNSTFYLALDRLPLGVAVTVEFIGPIVLSVITSRTRRHVAAAALAAIGIALLSEGLSGSNAVGLMLAALAGAAWAGYIVLGRRVARSWEGVSGLSAAMLIGAIALVPFAVLDAGGALADPGVLAACAVIGLLGSTIPYALDQMALRRISARAFSVLMSLHPAVGAVVGFLVLDQGLSAQTIAAIALVVVASIVAARSERLPEPA
jgi:inner membrane transporter RhtA